MMIRRLFCTKHSFQNTLLLPKTSFPLDGKLAAREAQWESHICSESYLVHLSEKNRDKTFVVHDGPPYANGAVHIGHFTNKVLKDFVVRRKISEGFKVSYVPGWDCHGLPIEMLAVKNMRFPEKEIDAESRERKIRREARKVAVAAIDNQRKSFMRWGVMADWVNPGGTYRTMDPVYEARQLKLFKHLVKERLIERRRKPVSWSPGSRSALAESELVYSENHVSQAVAVMFPLADNNSRALLAWTTTPWTLPANEALCINADLAYVECKMRTSDAGKDGPLSENSVIFAEPCLEFVRAHADVELVVVASFKGDKLVGAKALHPTVPDKIVPVLDGDHVEATTGTGVVHTAPGHGDIDYHMGQKHNLPVTSPVDDAGNFTREAGEKLRGLSVLSVGNTKVIEMMQSQKRLLFTHKLTHKYPYDWRSKTPVIFRATPQWFVALDEVKSAALVAAGKVQIIPSNGRSRLESFVSSRSEWCISRQRPWGVPLPVFYDSDTREPLLDVDVIEHVIQLVEKNGTDCWWDLSTEELLPEKFRGLKNARGDDSKFVKGTDTLDVWFDSGSSWMAAEPWRHLDPGYKGELPSHVGTDAELSVLPRQSDVYIEGSDQHRGWFQSSLLLCAAMHQETPYLRLVTHGFVLDASGRKMSKSEGNTTDPDTLIKTIGADPLRLWVASTDYTKDLIFGDEQLKKATEVLRKIRNVARFCIGNLGDFGVEEKRITDQLFFSEEASNNLAKALSSGYGLAVAGAQNPTLPELDRYMMHLLEQFSREVTEAYASFSFARVLSVVNSFAVHVSQFYMDISKDRLYAAKRNDMTRRCCQAILWRVLLALRTSIAPLACYTAHDIFIHTPPHLVTAHASPLEPPAQFPPLWYDAKLAARWEQFMFIRTETNQLFETLRVTKQIGSTLETEIELTLEIGGELAQALVSIGLAGCLDHLLQTSHARLVFVKNVQELEIADASDHGRAHKFLEVPSSMDPKAAGSRALVVLRMARKHKCPRCWKHNAINRNDVCKRCASVIADAPQSAP